MKRYLKSHSSVCKIEVVFDVEYAEADPEVAAATYKGVYVPEGDLLPEEKDVIVDSQAYADYETFLESVEELLTDHYDLEIYYKNKSEYGSFYCGMLAKDSEGTVLVDFELSLRVSTHKAHRTSESMKHKKEQKAAMQELKLDRKPQTIFKSIIVNNKKFTSYFEAIVYVFEIIEDALSVMTRKVT